MTVYLFFLVFGAAVFVGIAGALGSSLGVVDMQAILELVLRRVADLIPW